MNERQQREARKAVIVLDLLGEDITPENIEAWLASGDQVIGGLQQCPRCSVKTDCLYPMRQRNGKWEEILDGSEVGDHTHMFCYRCCGELEEGAE